MYSIRKTLVEFARHARFNRYKCFNRSESETEAACVSVLHRFLQNHFEMHVVDRALKFFRDLVHNQASQSDMSFVGSLFVCCRPPRPGTRTNHTNHTNCDDCDDCDDCDVYMDCVDYTTHATHATHALPSLPILPELSFRKIVHSTNKH